MYITLSSKNEASNSRFTNKFLDTASIPPNSSVALASFTCNQNLNDDTITIPAGDYIYLRVDGQNIIRLQPNPTQQIKYTKQQFVNTMNALIPPKKPFGSNIVFELDAANDIQIKFYTEDAYDYPIDFANYVYGSNQRSLFYYGVRNLTSSTNYPDINNILGTMGCLSLATPIQFATTISLAMPAYFSQNIPATSGLFFPSTTGTSWAFNRAKVFDFHDDLSNHIYDSLGVCFAPQAADGSEVVTRSWNINWGVSEFNRNSVRYSGVPGAILGAQKEHKEQLTLHGNFATSLNIWNNETNAFEQTNGTFLPGDVFQHYLQIPNIPAGGPPNDAQLYTPMYRQLGYRGLHYFLACCLNHVPDGPNRIYNTLQLKHEQADNFLQDQADEPYRDDNYLDRMGFQAATTETACNKAIGVQSGFGQYDGSTQNIDNCTPLFKSGKSLQIALNTAEAEAYFNNLPILTRRDATDGLGAVQNTLDRISLSRQRITTLGSHAIQIFFAPVDDSAYNNGVQSDNPTIISGVHDNGTETNVIQIFLNQASPHDIAISSKNNTQMPLMTTLTDGVGTRINIQAGSRYGLIVAFTAGDTTLEIKMWEINAAYTSATVYSATMTQPLLTFEGINNPQCLGARENADTTSNNAALGFSGTIGHFRLYNFPAATTQLTLPASGGDDFFTALGRQWIAALGDDITCCVPVITTMFNSTNVKYAVTGNRYVDDANEEETNNYSPFFYNDTPVGSANRLVNTHYPDLVDVFAIPAAILPFIGGYEGVNNLDASAYTGNGGGIILTNSYPYLDVRNEDAANQREIAPYTWHEPGEDNPWNTVNLEGENLDGENQAVRVHIENLPHRTMNGTTGNLSKAIYEIQSDADRKDIDDEKRVITTTIPEKIRIPLNNAGNVVINQFDVLLTDQEDKELTNILDHTSLTLEIL